MFFCFHYWCHISPCKYMMSGNFPPPVLPIRSCKENLNTKVICYGDMSAACSSNKPYLLDWVLFT